MPLTKKEISFDLDTKSLGKYYDNISNAYFELRMELKRAGFEHRQGSVYNSVSPMNYLEVASAMDKICSKLPWLSDCAKKIDVTNIGKTHNLLDKVKSSCNKYDDLRLEQQGRRRKRKSR
jgi:virulence-associated protein VapD